MINLRKITALIISAMFVLSGCARDLSSTSYTSDSTMNIVLEGIVISTREIKIKESDRLGDNTAGAMVGGLGGGVIAHSSGGQAGAIAGAAVAGSVIGALGQAALSSSRGTEIIVKIDKSQLSDDYYEGSALMRNAISAAKATGIITVIQTSEKDKTKQLVAGENVLVIISESRSRVIRNNTR